MGAITPEQVAETLAADAHSRYAGLITTGETLETTADDDIPQITQHILGIGNTGGPLLEEPEAEQNPLQEGLSALEMVGTGPGAGRSDPTITDPNYQNDPGEVDAEPDDLQTAQ